MNKDYPLLTVVIAALGLMMTVQIFGIYYQWFFPKDKQTTIYECDFAMGDSVLTRPCTIRGGWYE